MRVRAYVGLGGNVGGGGAVRAAFLGAAAALARVDGVTSVRLSSLWASAPCGPIAAQPEFSNACVEISLASCSATALVAELLAIERAYGRERAREVPMGPRTLDLDLLLLGELVVDDPGPPRAIVPHPRLFQRAFALAPLIELAGPELVVPGFGVAGALLVRLGEQQVRRLGPL